jgi:hypothetical protein
MRNKHNPNPGNGAIAHESSGRRNSALTYPPLQREGRRVSRTARCATGWGVQRKNNSPHPDRVRLRPKRSTHPLQGKVRKYAITLPPP